MPVQRRAQSQAWRKPSFVFLPRAIHSQATLPAFSLVAFCDFWISTCKFLIAHPAGRSGATLLHFSGGHNGSDRVAAGLPTPAPRVALMVRRREAQPLAHLAQPLAYRIPEPLALHSPRPFVMSIQVRVTAPANSPLPHVRRGWHRD